MKPSGRPTKCSEETLDLFCGTLADGMSIKSACVVAGIGVSTLNDWRKRHPELEQRIEHARELARQKACQEKGILEPSRQTLPPSNFTSRPINYAGQPMKRGESYGGGRFP
jgi:hypothetical protein